MSFLNQRTINHQPRALAIVADQNSIPHPVQTTIWMAIVMFMVRTWNNINPFKTQLTTPNRKLKLQLLTIYAVPSLFFFGTGAILLMLMYLCFFELILAAVR